MNVTITACLLCHRFYAALSAPMPHLQLCQVARHGRKMPVLIVAQVQHLQPHQVADATGKPPQPVAGHQQLLQRGATPHHTGHAGEAVAAAVKQPQRLVAAQSLRQGLQAVARQAQHLQKRTHIGQSGEPEAQRSSQWITWHTAAAS